ncbi:MAG: ROK family protein [Candidatus Eremiobacteraeota bacterium]|nr:ROK family protein [Candidatus Eremiobacteraeota bacterium]MBC5828312.1 ROK family protein [Candidatus Eremiobacteraeota bacterium]
MDWAIGIDLGGSHVTAATVDELGNVGDRFHRDLTSLEPKHVVSAMEDVFKKARKTLGKRAVRTVGVGSPGNIDPHDGIVAFSPNFGWRDVPLADMLAKKLKLPVHLLNDARCATLGEYLHGSGQGTTEFALITIGTGIGGGLVSRGRLLLGSQMGAGEVGHHTIRPDSGFVCGCGKVGCFESQASSTGLIRHALALAPSFPRSRLLTSHRDEDWGTKLIVKALGEGDPHAAAAWERYLDDLSIGLSNIIAFTNPQIIALGGGGGRVDPDVLARPLTALVDARTTMTPKGKTTIVSATLGNDAGAIGAATLARLGGISALTEPLALARVPVKKRRRRGRT